MKIQKEKKYTTLFAITGAIILLIPLGGLVLSIVNIVQKGFKSYGIIVLGVIVFLSFVLSILVLIKKRNPKSKLGKFTKKLIEDLIEGMVVILSFAVP